MTSVRFVVAGRCAAAGCVAAVLLGAAPPARAQEHPRAWLAAPATATVATPFRVKLRATFAADLTAGVPWNLPLTPGLRVAGAVPPTDATEGPGALARDVALVADTTTFAQIGPLDIALYDAAGKLVATVPVAPVFVEVPAGAARAEMLRPDKPLRAMPWQPPWRELTMALALMAAAALALWLWRRRGRQRAVPIDPFDELETTLVPWRAAAAAGAPLDREAAFALSAALRCLIERGTPIAALEMTGPELLAALSQFPSLPAYPTWQALGRHVVSLEDIKYLPEHATRALGDWLAPIDGWMAALRAVRDAAAAAA